MKKLFIALFFSAPLLIVAQPKLGLKFSPLLSTNNVETISDTLDIVKGGSAAKFGIGVIVDYAFSDTYTFSSGLIVVPKKVSVNIQGENGGTFPNASEAYNLQYLQIPLTLKLYTNEIAPDFNIFFQVGGAVEVKMDERPLEEGYILIDKFNPLDIMATIGAGVEYRVGVSTVLFGGFSFQRGLIDTVNETDPRNLDLTITNTVFSIDLGIKF